jgi:hypothetical protein
MVSEISTADGLSFLPTACAGIQGALRISTLNWPAIPPLPPIGKYRKYYYTITTP